MKNLLKLDRKLGRLIFVTTLPIVIQNLLDSAVNMADVVMVNSVSQEAMSAVSLASQATSLIFMFLFGVGTGMTMLGAQYWGKGDVSAIEKAQGIALRFTAVVAGLSIAACLLVPEWLMRIFTNDEALIPLGMTYMRIFAAAILPWGVATVYLSTLRATGRVAICTAVETASLLLNVALNALFIFVFRMGVTGVALATAISRGAELIACLVISARSTTVKLRVAPAFENHRALERDFASMCLPAIGNDLVWGLGFSMYTAILGHVSSDAVAAVAIVNVVRNLGCVLCYGLASASGIIVGQILGTGDRTEGIRVGRIMVWLSVITGAMGGLMIAATQPLVAEGANLTDLAREYLRFMLNVNVVYIMGTAINTTLIAGIFRAGGDTKFGFWCDTIDMWCWAVPLGALAAFVLHLDVKIVYLLLCTDEFVKWPWVFRNYRSGRWAKNITRDNVDAAA